MRFWGGISGSLIAVVDYGAGNLRSIGKALERLGAEVEVTEEPASVEAADAVVLPGVGAFDDGMRNLAGLRGSILEVVDSGRPLLGICLGMQMLLDSSEEGDEEGLGLIPGRSVRFQKGKVPHMGWNELTGLSHKLFEGVEEGSRVYFVHSYYAETGEEFVAAESEYHVEFPAAVARGGVVGLQFHPEKSGEVGLRILKNFVGMV